MPIVLVAAVGSAIPLARRAPGKWYEDKPSGPEPVPSPAGMPSRRDADFELALADGTYEGSIAGRPITIVVREWVRFLRIRDLAPVLGLDEQTLTDRFTALPASIRVFDAYPDAAGDQASRRYVTAEKASSVATTLMSPYAEEIHGIAPQAPAAVGAPAPARWSGDSTVGQQ